MLGGGLLLAQCPAIGVENCRTLYAQARSEADTLAVDQRAVEGRGRTVTCGRLRREGLLDRRSPATEQEPAAAGAGRGADLPT